MVVYSVIILMIIVLYLFIIAVFVGTVITNWIEGLLKRRKKKMEMLVNKDYYINDSGDVFSEDEIDVVWSEEFEAFISSDDNQEFYLDDSMSDIETYHLIK